MSNVKSYLWRGTNRFQQRQKGKILAPSREWLEQYLLAQGFQSIRISRNFHLSFAPRNEQITQLLKQLALLVRSAIPLKQALLMLQFGCQNVQIYQWLHAILQQIEAGFRFSVALEKQGKFLTSQEIQLIKIAEMSGNLALILTNLTSSREQSEKLLRKVRKIAFYPLLVLVISLTLSILLLLFIVPQFAELYAGKHQTLPVITALLLALSTSLQQHGGIVASFSGCVGFGWLRLRHHWVMQRLKLGIGANLPIFKQIITYSRIVFFCQNCALMLNAHIRLEPALQSFLSEKSTDFILQQAIQSCLVSLKQGYRFSEGLNSNHFSQEMIQMIAIGEQSGHLAEMLLQISQIYQQKLDDQMDILSQLLEPVLMLILGLIIGTIMFGLYLPIFDLGAIVE